MTPVKCVKHYLSVGLSLRSRNTRKSRSTVLRVCIPYSTSYIIQLG